MKIIVWMSMKSLSSYSGCNHHNQPYMFSLEDECVCLGDRKGTLNLQIRIPMHFIDKRICYLSKEKNRTSIYHLVNILCPFTRYPFFLDSRDSSTSSDSKRGWCCFLSGSHILKIYKSCGIVFKP